MIWEYGDAYKGHQKPRYFCTDSIILKGFELVGDHWNDQRVDEKIGENSWLRYLVSSKPISDPRVKDIPSITTV